MKSSVRRHYTILCTLAAILVDTTSYRLLNNDTLQAQSEISRAAVSQGLERSFFLANKAWFYSKDTGATKSYLQQKERKWKGVEV